MAWQDPVIVGPLYPLGAHQLRLKGYMEKRSKCEGIEAAAARSRVPMPDEPDDLSSVGDPTLRLKIRLGSCKKPRWSIISEQIHEEGGIEP